MFNIGDFVFDTIAGANVQIMERIELWGYTSYKVFNPANGSVYKATGEQLKRGGGEAQLDENYLRYVTLLSKIRNETSAGILSAQKERRLNRRVDADDGRDAAVFHVRHLRKKRAAA